MTEVSECVEWKGASFAQGRRNGIRFVRGEGASLSRRKVGKEASVPAGGGKDLAVGRRVSKCPGSK